jgi:A/G-specific adenine glycosylase
LPELEMNENPIPWVEGKGLSCIQSQPLPPIKHIFSHFLLYLHPIQLWVTSEKNQVTEQQDAGWHSLKAPWPGGISAPIMKLIKNSLN